MRAVAADLPELQVRAGGTTSVDISLRGYDKAFAIRELAASLDLPVDRIMFVGDRMSPDGNDYRRPRRGAWPSASPARRIPRGCATS